MLQSIMEAERVRTQHQAGRLRGVDVMLAVDDAEPAELPTAASNAASTTGAASDLPPESAEQSGSGMDPAQGHLPRQVTFGIGVAVQTQSPPYEQTPYATAEINGRSAENGVSAAPTNTDTDAGEGCLDCTGICYLIIAACLLAIGAIITFITARKQFSQTEDEKKGQRRTVLDPNGVCYLFCGCLLILVGVGISIMVSQDEEADEKQKGGNAAQLWIIGPIFLCSGVLVCVKAATHIYKRLHPPPTRPGHQLGGFLTPDSRASLDRVASVPPSYSAALDAPIPSNVLVQEEEEDGDQTGKTSVNGDAESLALVTLDFDPPPPSYDEAISIRRSTMESQQERRRDVGVQYSSPEIPSARGSQSLPEVSQL